MTGKDYPDEEKIQGAARLSKEAEPVVIQETGGQYQEREGLKERKEQIKPLVKKGGVSSKVEQVKPAKKKFQAPVEKKKKKKEISLPLTDDEIIEGNHARVWQSIRWLAVWCMRKLKKAHVVIREAHGKLIRS